MELPTFDPKTDWCPPRLADLPSWDGAKRVAVDIETRDPQLTTLGLGVRRDGYVVGVSFAIENGPAYYLPIRHAGGDNLPADQVWKYLRHQATVFRGDIVGANLQYDLDYLAEAGVEFQPRFFRDVQVAEPLLDELQNSYSLDAIAARHGIPGKAEDHLRMVATSWGVNPKSGLWQLPARHVGAYAEQDARLPLRLLRRQERLLEEQDLWGVYDLESRVLPVLLKMRRRGVRIDFDRLEGIEQWALEEEVAALRSVTKATGVKLSTEDTNRAVALEPAFLAVGVTVPRTEKANLPQVTTELLEGLGKDHVVAQGILRARKFNKLRNTFAASIRRYAVDGRIHATFNQLRRSRDSGGGDYGARYGRLSCVSPNLQQQPSRDPEIGSRWRSIYLPDDGAEWACLDFSQQEPRWLTHFAEKSNCTGAHEAAERYRHDPSMDTHQMMADITGLPRSKAKEIYLALCYGMGGGKLCRKVGLPVFQVMSRRMGRMIDIAGREGREMLDTFNTKAPFIQEMAERCEARAKRRGFIVTASGRRCRFPRHPNGREYDWTYRALNRLIQGSSGDQTKTAMVAADAASFPIQLQVHDEIDLSIQDRGAMEELAEIMRTCISCVIPHKIDIEIGDSWGTVE